MQSVPEEEDVVRAAGLAQGHDAVIATDADGNILVWNNAAVSLYGWTSQEVLGRNVLDVTPTMTSQREAEEVMRTLHQGRSWSGHFLVKRKGGEPVKIHVSDQPVMRDGRLIGIIGISRPAD